ncbi:hypothetical protein [Dyella acidiphila]|uniref:Uncharacterized protein n=1 Tax=Dyella acidiphila TaxID=2775866 RepID=A0ABR9GEQ7_9GAMM|nr:hypothetical protein [Dyella acidiphila]MBE1162536.1 hypothetical protein [Dyella acidiphila]
MLDTIDLLEAIGKDASLRHASSEQLAHTLEQVGASTALKAAAMTGDRSKLSADLGGGDGPIFVDHHSNAVWTEQH